MARSRAASGVYPYKVCLSCLMMGMMIFTVYFGQTAVVEFQSEKNKIANDLKLQELLTYKVKQSISVGKALTINEELSYLFDDYFTFYRGENIERDLTKREKQLILVYLKNDRAYTSLVNMTFNLIDENQDQFISDSEWSQFVSFLDENYPQGDFVNQSKRVKKYMKSIQSVEVLNDPSLLSSSQFIEYFSRLRNLSITRLQEEIDENSDYDDDDDDNDEEMDSQEDEIEYDSTSVEKQQSKDSVFSSQDSSEEQEELDQDQSNNSVSKKGNKILMEKPTIEEEQKFLGHVEIQNINIQEQPINLDLNQNEIPESEDSHTRILVQFETQFSIITTMAENIRKTHHQQKLQNLNEISQTQANRLLWILEKRRWDVICQTVFDIFDEDGDLVVKQEEVDDMINILRMDLELKKWIKNQLMILGLEEHVDTNNKFFFSQVQFMIVTERLRELYQRNQNEAQN